MKLSTLKDLTLIYCHGETSLQPVADLVGGLDVLRVWGCEGLEDDILELPYFKHSASVNINYSGEVQVVVSGKVRKDRSCYSDCSADEDGGSEDGGSDDGGSEDGGSEDGGSEDGGSEDGR